MHSLSAPDPQTLTAKSSHRKSLMIILVEQTHCILNPKGNVRNTMRERLVDALGGSSEEWYEDEGAWNSGDAKIELGTFWNFCNTSVSKRCSELWSNWGGHVTVSFLLCHQLFRNLSLVSLFFILCWNNKSMKGTMWHWVSFFSLNFTYSSLIIIETLGSKIVRRIKKLRVSAASLVDPEETSSSTEEKCCFFWHLCTICLHNRWNLKLKTHVINSWWPVSWKTHHPWRETKKQKPQMKQPEQDFFTGTLEKGDGQQDKRCWCLWQLLGLLSCPVKMM